MAKIKYFYNTETCKYDKVKHSVTSVLVSIVGFLTVAFLIALGIVPVYNSYFQSDREAKLQKENQELKLYYDLLNQEINQTNKVLGALQERDDKVYRVIFEAEPIASSIRSAGVGGVQRYQNLLDKGLSREDLILGLTKKVDQLKKRMYIQSKSYDEISSLSKAKAKMMACIPAIQPIAKNGASQLVSGFGFRIHPIYKVTQMHTGLDFSAPQGTPIYAAGDGIVKRADVFAGYGNCVEINHGYGYVTLYGHMKKFAVRFGQKVKRGELIGYVGSTGMSVAPHLHYEVIKNGEKVNPIYYFFNNITPAEYQKLLQQSSEENQSLGGN